MQQIAVSLAILFACQSQVFAQADNLPSDQLRHLSTAEKQAKIIELIAQIRELRMDLAGTTGPVTTRVEFFDIDRRDFDKIPEHVCRPSHEVVELMRDLLEQNRARLVFDQTITCADGHGSYLHIGGELPLRLPEAHLKFRKHGVEINLVTDQLDPNTVSISLRTRRSVLDASRVVSVNGQTFPGMMVHEGDTSTPIALGQSWILKQNFPLPFGGKPVESNGAQGGALAWSQWIIIVTPQPIVTTAAIRGSSQR